ncbi:MAG: gamma-glutamyl-gamma-aminobutyrate hydrolase family protein [Hyphomicrobiales bacterium]|nr:gamma-glutamyl-gamma-aminobutyrate hydrolase family protein [Hyphomicrobiales bacterium]MCP5000609.1 gamma-glutamyl-gamma-aminobutyrate hydrolase family protein [Hyphomicrobiales bacterium]
MPRAIIAIPADTREMDGYVWHASPEQYVSAALNAADVIPMIVPAFGLDLSGEADIDAILNRVDGVLISGARSNVSPVHYGDDETESNGPYDPARDATSLPLIRRALDCGIPLLAICRGIQELNVVLGGTLVTEIQDRPGNLDHRRPESNNPDVRFGIRQKIAVEPGSCLTDVLGGSTVLVNSLHRQAIGNLAPGLKVEATTQDGVVEAVSVRDAAAFAVGVQWHPEYWAQTDESSKRLFEAFGDAARSYAAAKANGKPI